MNRKSKKQIIVEEAAVLFNEMGYSATSMNDIARKLGVKAPSLYNHIKSKQEILSILLLSIANKFYKGIQEVTSTEDSYRFKLKEIIKMHIRVATENQHITALITHDWKHLEEPSLSKFVKIRLDYRKKLKEVILGGMKAGELKTANIEITLNAILSSLRWIYNSEIYADTSNVSLDELEKTLLDIVFSGVDENY
ncbi:TetR/AcrR family transcriptional regulator [Maribacter sp. IgM3_T14_3]|uniref:TetR/AcrR family transcriptional regulator n=1 Tax=Maribacter sp. IgM3_T14_3 TaxID=3415140 RepID=UPI003C6EE2D1